MNFTKTPQPITENQLKTLLAGNIQYTDWHPEIQKIVTTNPTIKFPGKNSLQFKMVNILAHNPDYAFSREHLEKIAEKLGVKSNDIIQTVNKTTQWGLQRWKGKFDGHGSATFYAIPEILFVQTHTRANYSSLDKNSKAQSEQRVREYFKHLSEEETYELGHKDPRKGITADNFVMQPSTINRSRRDKYIFDDNGLPKAPNPAYFIKNPEAFYNLEDLKIIRDGLNEFLKDK